MEIIGKRLCELRKSAHLSQAKMAKCLDIKQTSVARYETNISDPSLKVLLKYADFFDVSLDYILGRTDKPQGKQYDYRPPMDIYIPELKTFIEMCFDPNSPVSSKLKDTLYEAMIQEKIPFDQKENKP